MSNDHQYLGNKNMSSKLPFINDISDKEVTIHNRYSLPLSAPINDMSCKRANRYSLPLVKHCLNTVSGQNKYNNSEKVDFDATGINGANTQKPRNRTLTHVDSIIYTRESAKYSINNNTIGKSFPTNELRGVEVASSTSIKTRPLSSTNSPIRRRVAFTGDTQTSISAGNSPRTSKIFTVDEMSSVIKPSKSKSHSKTLSTSDNNSPPKPATHLSDVLKGEIFAFKKNYLNHLRDTVSCDEVNIMLLTENKEELLLYTSNQWFRVPAAASIAGACARTGGIIIVPDAYSDFRFERGVDMVTGCHTNNMVCHPLFRESTGAVVTVGVITLLNKRAHCEGFTESDVNYVSSYISQLDQVDSPLERLESLAKKVSVSSEMMRMIQTKNKRRNQYSQQTVASNNHSSDDKSSQSQSHSEVMSSGRQQQPPPPPLPTSSLPLQSTSRRNGRLFHHPSSPFVSITEEGDSFVNMYTALTTTTTATTTATAAAPAPCLWSTVNKQRLPPQQQQQPLLPEEKVLLSSSLTLLVRNPPRGPPPVNARAGASLWAIK